VIENSVRYHMHKMLCQNIHVITQGSSLPPPSSNGTVGSSHRQTILELGDTDILLTSNDCSNNQIT